MPVSTRTKMLAGAIVAALVGGYLAGFIPQYSRIRDMRTQQEADHNRVQTLEAEAKLDKATGLASAMFIDAVNKNYGTASARATEFFNHVRSIMDEPVTPEQHATLEWMLGQRDAVISALAKPDPAVQAQIQQILERSLRMTGLVKTPAA